MGKRVRFWSITAGSLGAIYPLFLYVSGLLIPDIGTVPTLSDYFHSRLNWLFVGGLLVMTGTFLFLSPILLRSKTIGFMVFGLAVATAIFPTPQCVPNNDQCVREKILHTGGVIHIASAVGLLLIFALILGYIVPKNIQRYSVLGTYFKAASLLIVACTLASLALAYEGSFVSYSTDYLNGPIFWLEAAAIITFSIAWIIYSMVWRANEGIQTSDFFS